MPTLHWETREEDLRAAGTVAYRTLEHRQTFGDDDNGNLLVRGDNLAALKSLLPHYAGRVKCVFIDPPYNTGNAFAHYDDNLEHSLWLQMMYPRLSLLREMLSDDGSIWITIDDNEAHYLKVVMDEIFGRKNFVCNFIWEKKRKASFLGRQAGSITDHVLCYGKNKSLCAPFTFGTVGENETYPLYNPGNKRSVLVFPPQTVRFYTMKDGDYGVKEYAEKTSVVKLSAPLTIAGGWNASELRIEGEWRYSQNAVSRQLNDGEHYVVKSGKFRPRRLLNGKSKEKKIHNLLSRGHYNMATNEDAADEILNLFGKRNFDYPKPEKLIYFILSAATCPGDLVLDSFLGSGTTAAVAHKMGRRWVGIESGEHAETHCVPRLRRVVGGESGGVSASAGWAGGGGFSYAALGGTVFDERGDIDPRLSFASLSAHVWFCETRTPLPLRRGRSPLLGVRNGVAVALLYNGVLRDKGVRGGNVLTRDTLRLVRGCLPRGFRGRLVVYGNGCRLQARRMAREGVRFCQIPYDCNQEKK